MPTTPGSSKRGSGRNTRRASLSKRGSGGNREHAADAQKPASTTRTLQTAFLVVLCLAVFGFVAAVTVAFKELGADGIHLDAISVSNRLTRQLRGRRGPTDAPWPPSHWHNAEPGRESPFAVPSRLPDPLAPGLNAPLHPENMLTIRTTGGPMKCRYDRHENRYLGGLTTAGEVQRSATVATELCDKDVDCGGVTCANSQNLENGCQPRRGTPYLAASDQQELSLVKVCDAAQSTATTEKAADSTKSNTPGIPGNGDVMSSANAASDSTSYLQADRKDHAEDAAKNSILLVVLAHNNDVDLKRCLAGLVKLEPHKYNVSLAVSLDDPRSYGTMETAVREFSTDVAPIDVWHKAPALKNGRFNTAVSKISQHHKAALQESFESKKYEFAIILENDLTVAPDFLWLFTITAPLLRKDPSLFCVSAWNDNGFQGMVSDEKRLFRTDYFPGLGWMIRNDTWELLRGQWPIFPSTGWDHWLRHGSGLRPRECIAPEVPRTHHFGEQGTNVKKGNAMSKKLANMVLSNSPAGTLQDVSYLLKDTYEANLLAILKKAEVISGGVDELIKHGTVHPGGTYLVPYVREEYKKLASKLRLYASQPRTAHKGLIFLRMNGAIVYLADRRQSRGGELSDSYLWHPNLQRSITAADPGQSCTKLCKRKGLRCEARELEFINNCEEMKKAFDCEDGCGHQVGPEIPSFVHARNRDTARQCLVTDDEIPTCDASCPATTRLCACVP